MNFSDQPSSGRPSGLWVRSYGVESAVQFHSFAQFVLPLQGRLEMEVDGRVATLDRTLAAYVDEGVVHDQVSKHPNRILIVDISAEQLGEQAVAALASRRFLSISPAAAHLIDYMAASLNYDHTLERAGLWTPLLVNALLTDSDQPESRLELLTRAIEADPGADWSVAQMASRVGVSQSRLHTLFRAELDSTPVAWLAERRMDSVRRWLSSSELSLAEIAHRAGYSDQSALTRAVKKATGQTPADYRRQRKSLGQKDERISQEPRRDTELP